ncbi:hypothetical protein ACF1BE_26305 [Streptomyces sp. NPDC014991]|uniref:hypothetical protein n=1 Tax=Streptomyces sp. NPDC014991 TaxID=3364935 RepID=UPI0036FABF04
MSLLPPIGEEIPCNMLAIDTPLKIRTSSITTDFRGGIKHRVVDNPDDPANSVRMMTVRFKISAELPDPNGDGGGGSITIEQNDVDVEPKSLLRVTQDSPPKFEHIMVLDFTMTIDGGDGRPLILATEDPATLIGELTQYPPKGDLYQLQNPVDLIDVEDPDTAVATLHKLPVKINGL